MIGPAIPEALLKKKQEKNEAEIEMSFSDDELEEQTVGPQIPTHILERKRQTPIAGPQILDHLIQQSQNKDEITISDEEDNYTPSIGPQISQQRVDKQVGLFIPDHLIQQRENTQNIGEIAISNQEDDDNAILGPQIPKHSSPPQEEEENPDEYAPALPPDLKEQRQHQQLPAVSGRRRRPVGPTFPAGFMSQQDDEDDIIGPALPKDYNPEEEAKYSAILAVEERARQSKEAIEKVTRKMVL